MGRGRRGVEGRGRRGGEGRGRDDRNTVDRKSSMVCVCVNTYHLVPLPGRCSHSSTCTGLTCPCRFLRAVRVGECEGGSECAMRRW